LRTADPVDNSTRRFQSAALIGALALAAALRVWGIGFGLPHTLTRPDEDATVSIAIGFVTRSFNPHFFDWPSLFMYAVAVAFAGYFAVGRVVGWFADSSAFLAAMSDQPAPLFRIARGVSAAAGVGTVATVHAIGVELFDRTTALVAAFFVACAALHVRDSHFGVTDIAATWLVTMSFLYTVRFARRERRRDALFAAVWAGLAASTKYNAGLIVLPLAAAVLTGRAGRRYQLLALCVGVTVVAFVCGTPYAILDRPAFVAALESISEHLRGGHAALAGPGWLVHLTSSLRYGLGLPLLIAGIGGLALGVARDRRDGVLFCLFPLTYYIFIGSGRTAFARYILPVVPFLCLAAARIVVTTAEGVAAAMKRERRAPLVAWALGIAIAVPSLASAIRSDRLLATPDSRLLAADWIHARFPGGVTIAQTGTVAAQVQMKTADPAQFARYRAGDIGHGSEAVPASLGARSQLPELIVVEDCPLPYCSLPDATRRLLAREYDLQQQFTAVDATLPDLAYDRDDDFYLPLAGFDAVTRPGPNISIFRRR